MPVVSPELLMLAPGWSPAFFVGRAARALRFGLSGQTVSELGGICIDGWRASDSPNSVAFDERIAQAHLYRQSNIQCFYLTLADEHWNPPEQEEIWCVQPGDVVVTKFAPIRAALAPENARRHPVDGNTIIVRGLVPDFAAWLAICLNRPEFQELLLISAGILRRVGLRALASLRLPPLPAVAPKLAAILFELLDRRVSIAEQHHLARLEADAAAASDEVGRDLGDGRFVPSSSLSSASWLPATVAISAFQSTLARQHAWVTLGDLATLASGDRLAAMPPNACVVRVSDVGDDLFVPSLPNGNDAQPWRTFSQPLVEGDVLVSLFGPNPRPAYLDAAVPVDAYPTDSWARLRFHQTPAAWALLLSTASIQAQIRRLVTGVVQQFVPRRALLTVHLPVPEQATLDRWQRTVERHHAQRRALDQTWNALLSDIAQLFDDIINATCAAPTQHQINVLGAR